MDDWSVYLSIFELYLFTTSYIVQENYNLHDISESLVHSLNFYFLSILAYFYACLSIFFNVQ